MRLLDQPGKAGLRWPDISGRLSLTVCAAQKGARDWSRIFARGQDFHVISRAKLQQPVRCVGLAFCGARPQEVCAKPGGAEDNDKKSGTG